MAEVEAICAKLQNNPIKTHDDRNNGMMLPNGSREFKHELTTSHRRKRKANVPKYRTHGRNIDDRSCGALDLTVNQQSQSEAEEDGEEIIDNQTDSNSVLGLSTFLQNPLANIFINSRELHDNFNFLSDNNKPYDFTNPKTSKSVANSDSKSEEDIKGSIVKLSTDSDFTLNMLNMSQILDKTTSSQKEPSTTQSIDLHEECIKRFSSFEECNNDQCRQNLLRDHFHCLQCKKTIMRREEMIRHSKWHKKREESLQFNFMRYSPGDDCKEALCSYNGRQTHYHCLHPDCNKIYISTSDVQMHSNFHKKDAAINQEGFQRYRATEFCCIPTCSYNNQRTTHFHCKRENCKFTFKNKADMDKHKGHHQRNDSLSKEGFRKYIKYEHCDYNGCKFSKLMNHIHCIRSNCDYVVHSSAQINSHRRKHERRILTSGSILPSDHKSDSSSILNLSKNPIASNHDQDDSQKRPPTLESDDSPLSAINSSIGNNNCQFINQISIRLKDWENSSDWTQETRRFTANDPCVAHCCLLYKDHYHCLFNGCNVAFKMKEKIRDHCRRHQIDKLLLEYCYNCCSDPDHLNAQTIGGNQAHYHCKLNGCSYLRVGPENIEGTSIDFNFLQEVYDHFDFHESRFHLLVNRCNKVVNRGGLQRQSSEDSSTNSDVYQFNAEAEKIDSLYNNNAERKRGRPPKYKKNIHIPKIELNDDEMNDDDLVMELTKDHFTVASNGIKCGFKFYPASNVFCADDMCMYYGRSEHYHCLRQRCHQATDSVTAVNLHRREFHHYMQIDVGYEYFDRSINCRRSQCQNNRVNNHYHCVRLNCDYSFKRFNTMHQHTRKHLETERQKSGSLDECPQILPTLTPKSEPSSTNYTANAFLSDYSRSFNSLFSFPKCPNDNINMSIIPALPSTVTGSLAPALNLNSLMNFNSALSPFHSSFNAFMNNNSQCYSTLYPPPSAKIPRL